MANKKITELPDATLPLAGTEKLEIVQGGVNKKVSASDLGGTGLDADIIDALEGANAPDAGNPYATMADVGSGVSQNLQEVTDEGATTANPIQVGESVQANDLIHSGFTRPFSANLNQGVEVLNSQGASVKLLWGQSYDGLDGDLNFLLPDLTTDGDFTLGKSVNGVPFDENGNVDVSGGGGTLEDTISADPDATSTPNFKGGINGVGAVNISNSAETGISLYKDDFDFQTSVESPDANVLTGSHTEEGGGSNFRQIIIDKLNSNWEFGIIGFISSTVRKVILGVQNGGAFNESKIIIDDFNSTIDINAATVKINGLKILTNVDDVTVLPLTLSDLTTNYPDADTGFKVYCDSILTVYEKTPTTWISDSYTIVT